MTTTNKEAEITYLDTVQPVSVKWLAYPFIPLGKLSLLIGDPGVGKSTIAVNIAAMLSVGKTMFDSEHEPLQGKTIYLSAEDNVSDTLKPRFVAAGADCSQIAVINNMGFDILADCQVLENAVARTGARLVVIDPLAAYIGRDADMCRAADMRRMMGSLAVIAERHECAILSISHLNKSSGTKSLYRGLGSIDIAASARSVMYIERSEDDSNVRIISHIKSSLAPEGRTQAFQIEDGSAVNFLGEYEGNVTENSGEGQDEEQRELAVNMILDLLSKGPMRSEALINALDDAGISKSTVYRAKKDLGIRSIKKMDGWYWTIN